MKWKAVIGIILVIASVAGMYFWEVRLRDEFTLVSVLAPAEDIATGEEVSSASFKEIRIRPEEKLTGAMESFDDGYYSGYVTVYPLIKNQQIVPAYFTKPAVEAPEPPVRPEGSRKFIINADWIFSRPDTYQKDDVVMIYALPDREYLGTYQITDIKADHAGNKSIQYSVEIESLLDEYFEIFDSYYIRNNSLLFVLE